MRDFFIRFGDIPESFRSWNNVDDVAEDGVSGFRARELDDDRWGVAAGETDMTPLLERPAFLFHAYEIGTGADGEPLFRGEDAKIVCRLSQVAPGVYKEFVQ